MWSEPPGAGSDSFYDIDVFDAKMIIIQINFISTEFIVLSHYDTSIVWLLLLLLLECSNPVQYWVNMWSDARPCVEITK